MPSSRAGTGFFFVGDGLEESNALTGRTMTLNTGRREYQAKDGRPVLVRHAAYGDAPLLHAGMLQVAREGITIGIEPEGVRDLPAVIERVRTYLMTPRMALLAAELDGQVVGAISIRPGPFGRKDSHWCRLGMWVVPPARGLGVGKALLETAIHWARNHEFEKVVAEVFGSNTVALALFRAFEFAEEGRQARLFALPGIGYADNILLALDIQANPS
jgi:ribosomal protein S18 acetylase RimI-like enzyme